MAEIKAKRKHFAISIHAPREGCDMAEIKAKRKHFAISIHAPREGCDGRLSALNLLLVVFQSTHPARGATRMAALA